MGPLGIKPRWWSNLGDGLRLLSINPRLWSYGVMLGDFQRYKTQFLVISGCRWSDYFFFVATCCCIGCDRGHYSLLLPIDSFRCRKDELGMLRHSCHSGSLRSCHIWGSAILCPCFAWTDLSSVCVQDWGISCMIEVW